MRSSKHRLNSHNLNSLKFKFRSNLMESILEAIADINRCKKQVQSLDEVEDMGQYVTEVYLKCTDRKSK